MYTSRVLRQVVRFTGRVLTPVVQYTSRTLQSRRH